MKKIMSYIVITALVLTFTACGNKDNEVVNNNLPVEQDQVNTENNVEQENNTEVNNEEVNKVEENKPVENKPVENKPAENKPVENKPAENKPVENKPVENKPAEEKPVENKPVEELPAEKPQEEQKQEENTSSSVGNVLLKDFKSKAATSTNMQELAQSLIENPIIQFMGGAMEIEEGYLSGFDNVEIKGFKSGAMFAPMIGSIPFVGYVFELENEADVAGFIKTLEDNANLRWNICVTADEMVSGSVGNKVFFVMSPTTFDAE